MGTFKQYSLIIIIVINGFKLNTPLFRCHCKEMLMIPRFFHEIQVQLGTQSCNIAGNMSMNYNIKARRLTYTCGTPPVKGCIQYTPKAGIDNESKSTKQHYYNDVLVKYLVTNAGFLNVCYKHSRELVCRFKYQKCSEGTHSPQLPCKEVCEDFVEGCVYWSRFLKINFIRDTKNICKLYPSMTGNEKCWYRAVNCGNPKQVTGFF